MRQSVRVSLALTLFASMTACGAENAPSDPVRVRSSSGAFNALVYADPYPASVGDNSFNVELADVEGFPVIGATLALSAWMPVHGHTMPSGYATLELGAGLYRIEHVALPMPGRWELRIEIVAQSAEDQLNLAIDVR
jgi:hypothetical protein